MTTCPIVPSHWMAARVRGRQRHSCRTITKCVRQRERRAGGARLPWAAACSEARSRLLAARRQPHVPSQAAADACSGGDQDVTVPSCGAEWQWQCNCGTAPAALTPFSPLFDTLLACVLESGRMSDCRLRSGRPDSAGYARCGICLRWRRGGGDGRGSQPEWMRRPALRR